MVTVECRPNDRRVLLRVDGRDLATKLPLARARPPVPTNSEVAGAVDRLTRFAGCMFTADGVADSRELSGAVAQNHRSSAEVLAAGSTVFGARHHSGSHAA